MTSYCNFSAVSDRSLRDNHGQSFFSFSSRTDLLSVSVSHSVIFLSSRLRTNYQLLDRSKMVSAILRSSYNTSVTYLPETVFSTSRCHAAKPQYSYYFQAGIWESSELYLSWTSTTWRANLCQLQASYQFGIPSTYASIPISSLTDSIQQS